MQAVFIQYIFLILVIVGLVMLSRKIKTAYPIVIVVGGLAFSFTGLFAEVTIDPELIFFIFLPPLLYDAAWRTSWKAFWKWRRVIMSFAFPIVILTSCVIAFASHAIIPGFSLALGFLLGGIVSPPDALSATTVMRQVRAPKSLVSIAEGESLLNDASSLIVFRFALVAVVTGHFRFTDAAANFLLVIVMGALIGFIIGLIFYAITRYLPTTPSIEIVLSFLAPYCMYYFAELFHYSGVLAVVTGGLLLSNRRQVMMSYGGRVQGSNVWSTIGFVLNGIVFMLIGLQLPYIVRQMEDVSLAQAIEYGLIISAVLIITRVLCTFGAALFTRFASQFIAVADPRPGWKIPFIFGLAGMRGVVSLAAALSIPLYAGNQVAFPYRNVILLITFVVILVTLVIQGLALPWIIKKIDLDDKDGQTREQAQELTIKKHIAQTSLKFLRDHHPEEHELNVHLKALASRLQADAEVFESDLEEFNRSGKEGVAKYQQVYLDMLEAQRATLRSLNEEEGYDEELIRKYLSLVDLEETKLRETSLF